MGQGWGDGGDTSGSPNGSCRPLEEVRGERPIGESGLQKHGIGPEVRPGGGVSLGEGMRQGANGHGLGGPQRSG